MTDTPQSRSPQSQTQTRKSGTASTQTACATRRPGSVRPAGQPAVPLAVWITPAAPVAPGRSWVLPPLLAQQLLAGYSRPGAAVLAVGDSAGPLAHAAAELDRRPPVRDDRRVVAGSVDLLVLTPPAGQTPGPTTEGDWRRWAQLLSPAGVLAVVLPPTRAPHQPAAVIAAAVDAGLSYLQHIPAAIWVLHEDHFDPPDLPAEPGQPGGVHPAHADVMLFTRPEFPDLTAEPDDGPGRNEQTASSRGGAR